MTHRSGPRILLVRLSAIGDVVVTTPAARALREAYPDAYLAWAVEPKSRGFLEGNPYLDEVIVWERDAPGGLLRSLAGISKELRARKFDWAIDFQGLLRSALLARASGARRVVGNARAREGAPLFYTDRVRKPRDPSNRQRCLELLQPLGVQSGDRRMVVHVTTQERERASVILRAEGVEVGERYACLVPATTWDHKHWYAPRWGALADLLHQRLGLTPVLMGSPDDIPMMDEIQDHARVRCAVAAGKTSLKVAAAILERATLAVSVDTALMHASVAVGTPTVGVVGPSWWPGFQDYEGLTLVREPIHCSPCLRHPTCGGKVDCMQALTPERVYAAVEAALREARGVVSIPELTVLP